jgi:NAD+ synthase (glutamine-hydrolysing)
VPIGDISYLIGNRYDGFDVLAFEICEEDWLGRRVGGILKDEGAEIFFNPSASHYSRGKYETRHRLLVDGSRAGDSVVAFANMHGCNGRLIFDGGATICERGTVRAQGKRFSQAAYTIVWADCDLDLVTASRCKTASNVPSSEAVALERVVVAEYNWYEHGSSDFYPTRQPSFAAEDWELGAHFDEEETCRANALAHRDWLYKNQLKGVALPFSGGRDSALAACYVKIMVELGVAELGLDGFKNYFVPYFPGIDGCFYPSDLVEKLLLTFYEEADNVCLPGEAEGKRISSHDTEKAAEGVAKALGAAYYKFPIGAIVSFVLTVIFTVIGKRLGRRLNWKDDGIPLQNLQARTRAFIAWFIANIENRLLITTSNRTEGATGYWTAGGDGEGGLAPNAGLSKEFICQILQVLQFHGLQGVDPIGELALVTGLDASAELLPTDMGAPQKDEDELGPFPVLNAIENATLENQRSPKEGLIELTMKTTQYTLGQLANWVERWHKLWFRNQWKREQATAGLHTEAHNVDPRAGFRAPIISGGFKQELAEMWDYVRRQEESSEDKSADEQAA